jgi:EKC/KEOPS complex subunit CGI121/TPRKB
MGGRLTMTQIAESFRRFGVSPTTTSLLIIKISTPSAQVTAQQIQEHLTKSIEGKQVPFEDDVISKLTDLARIKKIYKLNAAGRGGKKETAGGVTETEERKELEIFVLGSMALRGSTN